MEATTRPLAPSSWFNQSPFLTPVKTRLAALRRDLQTVVRDLSGHPPPPFLPRAALARHGHQIRPAVATGPEGRLVTIAAVQRPTRDAVTLVLACPEGQPFVFRPGQFLTLVVTLPDGQTARRAYSICVTPGELPAHQVAVTCKRVPGGLVSSHLVDHAREGAALRVLGPAGHFGHDCEQGDLLLIGGGSGITPLRSIARAALGRGQRVVLVYGNRGPEDILFAADIEALRAAHPGRFTVRPVLEAPPAGWDGGVGRLDQATCARELAPLYAALTAPRCLLCGPLGLMDGARAALVALGVPAETIEEERFSSRTTPDRAAASQRSEPLQVHAAGRRVDAVVLPGETLLAAGLRAGAPLPYSCTVGGCGACKVRLRSGAVVSDEPNCLSAAEREAGQILTCVSRAAGPVVLDLL